MLVVRLENVLEDIIKYECIPSGVEITKPILQRLDLLEKDVFDTNLFKITNIDEDSGGTKEDNRRKVSSSIKNFCLQALEIIPQHAVIDYKGLYKVNATLSMRSDDPFENYIKQRVEHTMRETTKPILEILDMLEQKVEDYGKHAIMSSGATSLSDSVNHRALPWHDGEIAKESGDEVTNDGESNKEKIVKISKENNDVQQDMSLVISDGSFEQSKRKKRRIIVRITSWAYNTTISPEASKLYLDVTKKRMDLLVETKEDLGYE